MDRTGAEFMELDQVQLSAITLVLAETILRETCAEFTHNPIARDLRDHARRGDGETVAITVDDRSLRQWKGNNRKAIDEDVLRWERERGQRGAHRAVGRAQNVNPVDLDRIDGADSPGNLAVS